MRGYRERYDAAKVIDRRHQRAAGQLGGKSALDGTKGLLGPGAGATGKQERTPAPNPRLPLAVHFW